MQTPDLNMQARPTVIVLLGEVPVTVVLIKWDERATLCATMRVLGIEEIPPFQVDLAIRPWRLMADEPVPPSRGRSRCPAPMLPLARSAHATHVSRSDTSGSPRLEEDTIAQQADLERGALRPIGGARAVCAHASEPESVGRQPGPRLRCETAPVPALLQQLGAGEGEGAGASVYQGEGGLTLIDPLNPCLPGTGPSMRTLDDYLHASQLWPYERRG